MKNDIDSPEVRSYLAAVEARLAHLPADQSEEILFGIREHIAEALERGGQSAPEVLSSLGSPDDVLTGLAGNFTAPPPALPQTTVLQQTARQPPVSQHPAAHQTARQDYPSSTLWVVATGILLPFGIFLAGIGYLFGLAGLWMGTRWKVWEKIAGTLLFPGGVLGAMYLSFLPIWNPQPAAHTNAAHGSLVEPILSGMSLGASAATACIPIIVAVYLLVVGLRRGRKL